jgi:putative ABC transport system substrate-binding protein
LADDLVRYQVSAIVAPGASAALAAKAATVTIPVVFWSGVDAVEARLITNLSRPEENLTGINSMTYQIAARQIELLHELLPGVTRLGFLVNPRVPNIEPVRLKSSLPASTARSTQHLWTYCRRSSMH